MQPLRSHLILATVLAVTFTAVPGASAAEPAAKPEHQVAAIYFHRTQRCPTCKKIGSYIDEAVRSGFADKLKEKTVAVYMIDFQDPKNAKYKQSYKVTGPTLVLADLHGGKVTAWKPMPKVWSLIGKKDEFFKYVQANVREYLENK